MNLSEPILISPLLDGFVMGDPISNHDGVRACPAMQLENEKKHIVKIISLPAAQSKLEALLLAGAFPNREAALDYFSELAEGVLEEARLLQKLARNEGYVSFEDWQLVPMENDETGFDVYLLSDYRPTLENVLRGNEMTHLQGINLGLDMCAALCAARRLGYLYTNLRPSNIFICNGNEFRIGDLGFMHIDSLQYSSLPDKYRSDYTAPEISDAFSALNLTMDTYAAGLILYQAYNDGQLPVIGPSIAPPRYADSALAEIILKACAFDPEERWQDPVLMGQALANYMQTNPVNDTPIVPPAPVVEEAPVEEVFPDVDDEPSTADILAEVDDALDAVAAMLPVQISVDEVSSDETSPEDAPEEPGAEIAATDESVTERTEIIAEDELVAEVSEEAPQNNEAETPPDAEEVSEQPVTEETSDEETSKDETETTPTYATTVDDVEIYEPEEKTALNRKNRYKGLTIACVLVAVALFLITGISVFYQNYYLQTIDDIILTGKEDTLTATLVTDIADEKLSVICTDTHGNALLSPVVNGVATFEGLKPDTSYTVEVRIEGMHKLLGEIKETYSTGSATVISGFYATTGLDDGSVILYFASQGPESPQWTITYWAEGEEEITTAPFTGRQYTISGLTVGKEYTFTLSPVKDLYVTGNNTTCYTISSVIYPEDLRALGFTEQGLGISWKCPAGAAVSKWTVHCYNDAGYDEMLTTEDTSIYFKDLDPSCEYTIEVRAEGMSLGTRIYISANAISIDDLQVDDSDPQILKVTWNCNGEVPAGGWLLIYTIDNSTQQIISCAESSGIIPLYIPGAHYTIRVKSTDGNTVFGGELEYDTPEAEKFSGFLVTADNMTFSMCKTPAMSDWTYKDVNAKDYSTSFALGQSAAFVAHLDTKTSKDDTQVTTMYVIHDHEGRLVSVKTHVWTWDDMWNNRYGEFVIPVMPDDAGSYTVDIYFDGAAVFSQEFSISARG